MRKISIALLRWPWKTEHLEAIYAQFNLNEAAVINLMRKKLSRNAFIRWRKRMQQNNQTR